MARTSTQVCVLTSLAALTAVAVCPSTALAQPLPAGPLPETSGSIGYPSVAKALAGLRARSDVEFSDQNGWTIVVDAKARTIWSFAPSTYPAHPAVVKREVVAAPGGRARLKMSVRCEADKQPCDDLVRTFAQMNTNAAGAAPASR